MDEDIIVTLKRSNDLLMTFGNDYSDVFLPAIDEIERLREALLDAVGFVSRADCLFLRKATTDTLKGIPDGYR